MSKSIANQIRRDADYCREYRVWLLSLSPAERKKVEEMGLDKPDVSRRIAGIRDRVDLHTLEAIASRHDSPIAHHDAGPAAHEDEPHSSSAEPDIGLVADSFTAFLHWVINPHPLGKGTLNPKAVAQRAIMATWVIRPDMIKGRTLTELAALLDTSPEVLSRQATSFSKRFGIKGRSQYSQRTRSRMRRAKEQDRQPLEELDLFTLTQDVDPSTN